jgi:hypothetical protein
LGLQPGRLSIQLLVFPSARGMPGWFKAQENAKRY